MSNTNRKTKIIISVIAAAAALLIVTTALLVWYFNPTVDYDFDSFINRHEIEIPEGFETHESAEEFYLFVLNDLKSNPRADFAFGWIGYELFARRIQIAYLEDNHRLVSNSMRETLAKLEETYKN